ncbi:MAG TPA: hypothetical protein VHY22_15245 [Chthoniobacteraceae bacterium]|jgi:hypothetical protein|nr:hypothetical protein [Chthoniobacteraceae bacterium]
MALSRCTTTVARLRGSLGRRHGQEARFARLAGRSVSWVKKVSAGREPLTGDMALQLEQATGVAAAWLLNGDPAIPPVTAAGNEFNLAAFEHHRAGEEAGEARKASAPPLPAALQMLPGIAASAAKQGRASLFQYRLSRFLEECREEFGLVQPANLQPGKEKATARIPEIETGAPEMEVHLL